MTKYYKDYYWKDGIPYGMEPIEEIAKTDSYKIIMDPYKKRISIESYLKGQFSTVLYDSILLDFRQLKQPEQTAWQKIPITETPDLMVCLIRDHDDRVLFIETHVFVNNLCRECRVSTPQSTPLSVHKMLYKNLGDPFDGVILYDHNEHPVMYKRYEFNENEQQFTNLLEEEWNMLEKPPLHLLKKT
jgi:hypothetical protein